MSKWDNIPNEIMELVLEKLGDEEKPRTDWMFVNKQWLYLHQSMKYKDVVIHLDNNTEDKIINNIIHSVFQPGRWVKSIEFSSLNAPPNFNSLNVDVEDPLNMLMSCCPQVKTVTLPVANMSAVNWSYFITILMNNNNWKLHSLVVDSLALKKCAKYYYICAYHLRSSLRMLMLTEGMITDRNYMVLQNFEQLMTLKTDDTVADSVRDCCGILEYLPHLDEIEARFPLSLYPHYSSNRIRTIVRNSYPNFKRLRLLAYAPSSDYDISLIEKFDKLEYLQILCLTVDRISPSTLKSLFQFIHSTVSEFANSFCVNDEEQFLKTYYDSMEDMKPHDHTIYLIIRFQEDKAINLPTSRMINMGSCDDNATNVVYDVLNNWTLDDTGIQRSKTRSILSLDNDCIQELHVTIDGSLESDDTGFYVNGMSNYRNLGKIKIYGGSFNTGIIQDQTKLQSSSIPHHQHESVKQLSFNYSEIGDEFLPLISKSFPCLERLKFNTCFFLSFGTSERTTVVLPDTSIDTLMFSDKGYGMGGRLVYQDDIVLLISVVSIQQHISRYYVCVNATNAVDEINEGTFDVMLTHFKKVSVIDVQVKSINTMLVKITNNNINHDIKISFP